MEQTRYAIKRSAVSRVTIRWIHGENGEQGNCVVVVKDEDDEAAERRDGITFGGSFEPMTLGEIRMFIAHDIRILGHQIHDCLGIARGDEVILFDIPIQVRNRHPYWQSNPGK